MAPDAGHDDDPRPTRQVRAVDLLGDDTEGPLPGTAAPRTSPPAAGGPATGEDQGAAWVPPGPDPSIARAHVAAAATGPHPATGPQADTGPHAATSARGSGGPQPATQPSGRNRTPLRHRVLPRSLLGITALILSFAVGAGLSGVVLYSYYQYKLNQTNERVNTLINGYKQQFANAEGELQASARAATANIQSQLGPIQALEASPATLANLAKQLAPSVFFVHTLDGDGQASVGTAFVISSNATQSLLLTSYTTVAATTRAPAPEVFVRQGQTDTKVTVRTWDPSYDLALIVLPVGNLPVVTAAPSSPTPQSGQRLYAVSGLGSAGAAVSQGTITDVSASGLQHDTPIGTPYQGGPLVNQAGQVLAVASRTYAPLGFTTDAVWYAPYVQAACNKVLTCPSGNINGSQ